MNVPHLYCPYCERVPQPCRSCAFDVRVVSVSIGRVRVVKHALGKETVEHARCGRVFYPVSSWSKHRSGTTSGRNANPATLHGATCAVNKWTAVVARSPSTNTLLHWAQRASLIAHCSVLTHVVLSTVFRFLVVPLLTRTHVVVLSCNENRTAGGST